LFSLDLVKSSAVVAIFALTFALEACDNDIDLNGLDKFHVFSPSGSCVAWVQENKNLGWTGVLINFQSGCGHSVMEFDRTDIPIKLQWLNSTTLEIRYPKDVSPKCGHDESNQEVDCFGLGPKIRVVMVQI
jgi:hypothetical protein